MGIGFHAQCECSLVPLHAPLEHTSKRMLGDVTCHKGGWGNEAPEEDSTAHLRIRFLTPRPPGGGSSAHHYQVEWGGVNPRGGGGTPKGGGAWEPPPLVL